jgi:hypothetical protein
VLASEAADEGGAAWRGGAEDPDRAIDDSGTIWPRSSRCSTPAIRRRSGHAHYLLGLNESLRRSVISQWARPRRGRPVTG